MATQIIPEAVDDGTLLDQVLGGDTAAFEVLMRRYNQRLYRMVRSILRDDAEAEDVLQEAYVRAFEHLRGFERRSSFPTWLGRIAIHAALKRLRARKRLEPLASDGAVEDRMMALREPDGHSPEQAAALSELRQLLEAAIDRLPLRYRAVLMLRDVEEMSTEETARSLRLSSVNVKVRLHRARALLRRELCTHVESVRGRIFEFPAARCDRVVQAVYARLALQPRPSTSAAGQPLR